MKESQGAKSNEYGECGTTSIFLDAKDSSMDRTECDWHIVMMQ